ncbi:MAG TPA: hypothetical protein DC017_11870 [Candidatus Wallbacteria bacterium]|nr:hypothetical protein [Candidatus Wallbacteria bacterium]
MILKMLKKILSAACFAAICSFTFSAGIFAQGDPTGSVEIEKAVATTEVTAMPPIVPELSVSTGTDLKIIDLSCKKTTEECVLTWKTSVAPPPRAKIVFWSGDQPNILDPSFAISGTTGVLLHKYALKASEIPQKLLKIRLSYIISEDAGAYSDVMAKDIISE